MMEATLDAMEPIQRPRGRPRRRPQKLHADKAYNAAKVRQGLRRRGIPPRIARRGVESSERLGRYRWGVERTHAWLNRFGQQAPVVFSPIGQQDPLQIGPHGQCTGGFRLKLLLKVAFRCSGMRP